MLAGLCFPIAFLASVDVVIVNRAGLAPVRHSDAEQIVSAASQMLRRHFGSRPPKWRIQGPFTTTDWMSIDDKAQKRCQSVLVPHTVRSVSDFERPSLRTDVARFLDRWPLAVLQKSFPGSHDQLDVARRLLADMAVHAERSLPGLQMGDRFSDWACVLQQHKDTVVLTNATIYFDWLSEPFPHTIRNGSFVSGATIGSPQSDNLFGRSIVVSTSLQTTPGASPRDLGEFILAHEMGHAVLRLRDVYDHGVHCLMNTDPSEPRAKQVKRLGEVRGYRCKKCAAHRAAARAFERVTTLARQKRFAAAERHLRRSLSSLPSSADGEIAEWRSYQLSSLSSRLLAAQRTTQAARLATEALSYWPENTAAQEVLLQARATSGASAR